MNTSAFRGTRYAVAVMVQLLLAAVLGASPAAASTPTLVESVQLSGEAGAVTVTLPNQVTIPKGYGPDGLFEVLGGAQESFVGFALLRVTEDRGPVGVFAGLLPSAARGIPHVATPGGTSTLEPGRYELVLMTSEPAHVHIRLPGLAAGAVALVPNAPADYHASLLTEQTATPTTYSAGDSYELAHADAVTFGAHWLTSPRHIVGQYSVCRTAFPLVEPLAYSHVCPLGERTDTVRTDTVVEGGFFGMVTSMRSGNDLSRTAGIGGVSTVAHPYTSAGALGVWLSLPGDA